MAAQFLSHIHFNILDIAKVLRASCSIVMKLLEGLYHRSWGNYFLSNGPSISQSLSAFMAKFSSSPSGNFLLASTLKRPQDLVFSGFSQNNMQSQSDPHMVALLLDHSAA
jgi:hypothetical protein